MKGRAPLPICWKKIGLGFKCLFCNCFNLRGQGGVGAELEASGPASSLEGFQAGGCASAMGPAFTRIKDPFGVPFYLDINSGMCMNTHYG